MKILNLYYSMGGNTEQVAQRITAAAEEAGHEVDTVRVPTEAAVDVLDYDFVFAGSGVYQWLPGKPMMELVGRVMKVHSGRGEIQLCCPRRAGKKVVVYCTYGGPHTGVREAVPAAKWLGQFFEHLGLEVVAEWYVVGAFHGEFAKNNTGGRLGDITARPNAEDLRQVGEMVKGILKV